MFTLPALPAIFQAPARPPEAPAARPKPAPARPAPAGDAMAFTGKPAPGHWSGTVAGRRITWDATDIAVAGPKGRFSLKDELLAGLEPKETAGSATADVKLLAAAGDYLSVRESWETYFGTYPQTYTVFTTFDLGTGEPAKLTDLFPAADVRKALLADPAIQRAMREQGIKQPAPTLEGFLEQIQGATIYGSKDRDEMYSGQLWGVDKFALHSVSNGKVGVRVVLDQPGGNHHALPVQLGLLLPIPPALREPLTKAASGREGALMDRMSRVGATTSLDFTPFLQPLPSQE
jgi:hypothetical protein